MRHYKGHTLVELSISIFILILLATAAAPSMYQVITKSQSDTIVESTYHQLVLAREMAVDSGKNFTVCGTVNQVTCVPTAFDYTMIFHDQNNNKRVDEDEEIEMLFNIPNLYGYVEWNRNGIIFRKNGSANSGSMIYCPNDSNQKNIRRLSVSFAGRIYVAKGASDGLIKSASGKSINC